MWQKRILCVLVILINNSKNTNCGTNNANIGKFRNHFRNTIRNEVQYYVKNALQKDIRNKINSAVWHTITSQILHELDDRPNGISEGKASKKVRYLYLS